VFLTHPGYHRAWGGTDADLVGPCAHLGGETGERVGCPTCKGRVQIKLMACAVHGKCTVGKALPGVASCRCPEFSQTRLARADDPACGVVIGSYGYPALIELQIRVIKFVCGNVPILISDDLSPDNKDLQIREIAGRYDAVDVLVSESRIGHTGGDLAAFYRGLLWAAQRRLSALAKLSNRFILTDSYWLQNGAKAMLAAGAATSGQLHGPGIPRTEAILLDVQKWHRPDIIGHLRPRRLNRDTESYIWAAIQNYFGGQVFPWAAIPAQACEVRPGVLWHDSMAMVVYHELAAKFGIALDADLTNAGSHTRADYQLG